MSAAFAGRFVERDIHKSSLIACICFTTGMVGTGLVINFAQGWVALIGIYLFYGVIMGIGLGVGYLTPVKTLMLWFSEHKGLATGISIMGFGLAKAIATPIMEALQGSFGISAMFYILGAVYFALMFVAHLILKKPDNWQEPKEKQKSNAIFMFKNKQFIGIWLMFYLNIHCGLMIISYEKQIITTVFTTAVVSTSVLAAMLSIVPSITAGFNALGRIGYSTLSDRFKERNTVYKIIFFSCIVITGLTLFTHSLYNISLSFIVLLFLFIVNAGYGGGFSTLPALLSERFGMDNISEIHGLALSAWAIAGITGNNMSEIILNNTNSNYEIVLCCGLGLYFIAFLISTFIVKEKSKFIKK
jgi:OFA family oxalate/formate antiporter-like MFS transporter